MLTSANFQNKWLVNYLQFSKGHSFREPPGTLIVGPIPLEQPGVKGHNADGHVQDWITTFVSASHNCNNHIHPSVTLTKKHARLKKSQQNYTM